MMIMINFILFIIMSCCALYINYSWSKYCEEINDKWVKRCEEINDKCGCFYEPYGKEHKCKKSKGVD